MTTLHRIQVNTGSYITGFPPTLESKNVPGLKVTLHYSEHVFCGHSIVIRNAFDDYVLIDPSVPRVISSKGNAERIIQEAMPEFLSKESLP